MRYLKTAHGTLRRQGGGCLLWATCSLWCVTGEVRSAERPPDPAQGPAQAAVAVRGSPAEPLALRATSETLSGAPFSPSEALRASDSRQSPESKPGIEIGIAYGTEKRSWLEWATREFAATGEGRRIGVNLIPLGSVESAHAILDGDQRIHVWAPASSLYRETLLRDWKTRNRGNLIVREEPLALSPMVIVMWKDRYDAFTVRSPEVSLTTIYYAMHAKGGWGGIAGKPEWGVFKFGHTHPNQSNSGLMTLILMAYGYCGRNAGLTVTDVSAAKFHQYLAWFERGVAGLSNSTGNLMQEMVVKGPSGFDALMVYESVAIDCLRTAEGKWGRLQIVYPKQNLWNENPYCILSTPWSDEEHQRAAETFLRFLLSEPIQARALDFGFRPGNPAVSMKGPDSPFVKFAEYGLNRELAQMCQVPSAEVIENLQQAWIRYAVPR